MRCSRRRSWISASELRAPSRTELTPLNNPKRRRGRTLQKALNSESIPSHWERSPLLTLRVSCCPPFALEANFESQIKTLGPERRVVKRKRGPRRPGRGQTADLAAVDGLVDLFARPDHLRPIDQ